MQLYQYTEYYFQDTNWSLVPDFFLLTVVVECAQVCRKTTITQNCKEKQNTMYYRYSKCRYADDSDRIQS